MLYRLKIKNRLFIKVATVVCMAGLVFNPLMSCFNSDQKNLEVCFAPNGGCIQLIEKVISKAQREILVQAYYFTSPIISKYLVNAYKRGVVIKILVDRSQLSQPRSQLKVLLQSGISIWVDSVRGIAHNKTMVIDDQYVLTGSYNWTYSAEYKNAENLILISDESISKEYKENFKKRIETAQYIRLSDIKKATW